MYGVVVAYAVGGSFFLFVVCGMVVVHRLVFLFLLIFESSFWGSAFCLFGWWAFSRGLGLSGVPPFVSLGCILFLLSFCIGCPVSGFSGAGFSVCCGWGLLGCVCERGFLVYSGKRRLVPFALSVRYTFGCNFLLWGAENQPVGVVY